MVLEEISEELTASPPSQHLRTVVSRPPLLQSNYRTWAPHRLFAYIVRYARAFGFNEPIEPRQEAAIVPYWSSRWQLNPKDAPLHTLSERLHGKILASSRRMTQLCQRELRRIAHLHRFAEMLRAYLFIPSRDLMLLSC